MKQFLSSDLIVMGNVVMRVKFVVSDVGTCLDTITPYPFQREAVLV